MVTDKLVDILDSRGCFMEYSDSISLPYNTQQVFDVVADIEKYPEFLRGWISVTVLDRKENQLLVEQELGFPFMNWKFETEAILEPPCHIHIRSFGGSFLDLEIEWNIVPLGSSQSRLTLSVKSNSNPGPQHRFLHGVLTASRMSVLDCFRQRLAHMYAGSNAVVV